MVKDIELLLKKPRKIARLIPSLADSKREERATSSLLATFMIVPDFTHAVLGEAGAKISSAAKIKCYTEVTFDLKEATSIRPDGLIIVNNRGRQWSALVEAKIGNAMHETDQVENYLTLARSLDIDGIITISNQFALLPTHSPIKVSKMKLKKVDLFHFSWLSIISKAYLLYANEDIEDEEQDYVLRELAYYLEDPSSGIKSNVEMKAGWSDVYDCIRQQKVLKPTLSEVQEAVSSWQQTIRYLAIQLSKEVDLPVNVYLSRSRAKDAEVNFRTDIEGLVKNHQLDADFKIPDAASLIHFSANFHSRTVTFSMKLEAPKDRQRATASINWLTRQFKGKDISNVRVVAHWPRRVERTVESMQKVMDDSSILIPENCKELPTAFEVAKDIDLLSSFKARRKFADIVSDGLLEYYEQVGQWLSVWTPKAPKIKPDDSEGEDYS